MCVCVCVQNQSALESTLASITDLLDAGQNASLQQTAALQQITSDLDELQRILDSLDSTGGLFTVVNVYMCRYLQQPANPLNSVPT